MKTTELKAMIESLLERLRHDGYSESVIGTSRWILSHFQRYCEEKGIEEANVPVAASFVKECFGFDYYNIDTKVPMQTVMRRPLLVIFEFEQSGNFKKTHQRGSTTEIPLVYESLYREFVDYVNTMKCCRKTRERKVWSFVKYLDYLVNVGIGKTSEIEFQTVHDYINSLTGYAPATIRCIKTNLREAYDWMFEKKFIPYSGRLVFPEIRKDSRNKLLSYYSRDEVSQILSCIDTETPTGKCMLAAISLMAFLGMRAGDIITLRFSDIDWQKDLIAYRQQKTGLPVCLPLVDEVKFPLLDYIKNGRHESTDPDYVFVTMYAPYTRYSCTSSLFHMVDKCMRVAGIEFEGRHHGPHSLRHSLATNLMAENVPISAIANILGHSSTRTTEAYLSVNEENLRMISLEVPYET